MWDVRKHRAILISDKIIYPRTLRGIWGARATCNRKDGKALEMDGNADPWAPWYHLASGAALGLRAQWDHVS